MDSSGLPEAPREPHAIMRARPAAGRLRRRPNPDALDFHGSDVHWDDAGLELAARVVAEHVLEQRLLP